MARFTDSKVNEVLNEIVLPQLKRALFDVPSDYEFHKAIKSMRYDKDKNGQLVLIYILDKKKAENLIKKYPNWLTK